MGPLPPQLPGGGGRFDALATATPGTPSGRTTSALQPPLQQAVISFGNRVAHNSPASIGAALSPGRLGGRVSSSATPLNCARPPLPPSSPPDPTGGGSWAHASITIPPEHTGMRGDAGAECRTPLSSCYVRGGNTKSASSGSRETPPAAHPLSTSLSHARSGRGGRGEGGSSPEADRRRNQREKQVSFGYVTEGYRNMVRLIESDPVLRSGGILPLAPPDIVKGSKRTWDIQLRKWRRALHMFDYVFIDGEDDEELRPVVAEEQRKQWVSVAFTELPKEDRIRHALEALLSIQNASSVPATIPVEEDLKCILRDESCYESVRSVVPQGASSLTKGTDISPLEAGIKIHIAPSTAMLQQQHEKRQQRLQAEAAAAREASPTRPTSLEAVTVLQGSPAPVQPSPRFPLPAGGATVHASSSPSATQRLTFASSSAACPSMRQPSTVAPFRMSPSMSPSPARPAIGGGGGSVYHPSGNCVPTGGQLLPVPSPLATQPPFDGAISQMLSHGSLLVPGSKVFPVQSRPQQPVAQQNNSVYRHYQAARSSAPLHWDPISASGVGIPSPASAMTMPAGPISSMDATCTTPAQCRTTPPTNRPARYVTMLPSNAGEPNLRQIREASMAAAAAAAAAAATSTPTIASSFQGPRSLIMSTDPIVSDDVFPMATPSRSPAFATPGASAATPYSTVKTLPVDRETGASPQRVLFGDECPTVAKSVGAIGEPLLEEDEDDHLLKAKTTTPHAAGRGYDVFHVCEDSFVH